MNLQVERAVKMPFVGKDWASKLFVGALIWLAAIVAGAVAGIAGFIGYLLILSLVTGYSVAVMRQEIFAPANALPDSLPEWGDWERLLKDGLKVTFLNTVYMGISVFLGVLVTIMMGVSNAAFEQALDGQFANVSTFVVVVWMLMLVSISLVWAIYIPMMAAHFAREGRFMAALEVVTITRMSVAAVIDLSGVLVVMVGAMLGIVAVLAKFTIVLWPFAGFIWQVVMANLWAQVYKKVSTKSTNTTP